MRFLCVQYRLIVSRQFEDYYFNLGIYRPRFCTYMLVRDLLSLSLLYIQDLNSAPRHSEDSMELVIMDNLVRPK